MNRFSISIAGYILRTITPYLIFSWLLLSVILFVQQASRYSDIFFNNNLPSSLVWQLTFALVPSVIAFTCPMGILIGVIIGISKLQGDSELIAIRSVGISNLQITLPIILLGILLSAFAFFINLKGVPAAAQIVRMVATQTALYKLESPIEPGVFNTEIQGFTIYVKEGDIEKGTWKNIFIYTEDANSRQMRLITSQNGRIDSKNDVSELVLEKASVHTFSSEKPRKILFSEKVQNLRFVIQTKRADLINRLSKTEDSPEEMGLTELAAYARSREGKERVEAEILWQRRLVLSISPLLFGLLGAALILRFNRAGKGFGLFLALISLIAYYLAALLGEQLARTGVISVFTASLFPIILTCLTIAWLFLSQKIFLKMPARNLSGRFNFGFFDGKGASSSRRSLRSLSTGILDFDIVGSLLRYFLLTFGFLAAVYVIFTAFELWKFAGNIENGITLLLKYLFYLIPYIYIQLAPTALMIAMLATYVIKSRQNEVVTWTASGQSIYRLLLPCFVLMIIIGLFNWQIQERILPEGNQIQDALRTQIRSGGVSNLSTGKYWVAHENRIYSFEIPETAAADSASRNVSNLTIYQFTDDGTRLQSYLNTGAASWEKGKIKLLGEVEKTVWINELPQAEKGGAEREIAENYNPFKQTSVKPAHLNSAELAGQLKIIESESEQRAFAVALQKKHSTLVLPFVLTLFTAPFALSLSRKGKVVTLGYAVAIWLVFMGVSSSFEQFGLSGYLSPEFAVWSPLLLFSLFGFYLLSKVRT
jgi:lipopolysaccharide export LptBFGC system permease protein LptF